MGRTYSSVELGAHRLAEVLAFLLVVGALGWVADLAADLGGCSVGVAWKGGGC